MGSLYETKFLIYLRVIMLMLTTVALIVFCVFYNFQFSNLNYFNKLSTYWQRTPVLDILFSNLTDKCEDGSQFFNSSYDQWLGTVNTCSYSNRYSACTKTVSKISYNSWNKKNICFKKSSINYINSFIVPNSTNCPDNRKKCGYVDSLYNILCLNSFDTCPINFMQILSLNDTIPQS